MTLRDLLLQALTYTTDLDREVKLRVVHRDSEGCVQKVQYVPIARMFAVTRGPYIVVEESDLNAAKVEEP